MRTAPGDLQPEHWEILAKIPRFNWAYRTIFHHPSFEVEKYLTELTELGYVQRTRKPPGALKEMDRFFYMRTFMGHRMLQQYHDRGATS